MDQKDIDKRFTFEDRDGNLFSCEDGRLSLRLKSETRVRKIGKIIYNAEKKILIYKKREDENQIHRKTNSWSVPVHIYEKIDGIWFYTNLYNYKILKKEAEKAKSYLSFKKAGYENKVYIPLQLWHTKPVV